MKSMGDATIARATERNRSPSSRRGHRIPSATPPPWVFVHEPHDDIRGHQPRGKTGEEGRDCGGLQDDLRETEENDPGDAGADNPVGQIALQAEQRRLGVVGRRGLA